MKQDLFELICSVGEPKEGFLFDGHQTPAGKILMDSLSISLTEAKLLMVIFLMQFTNKGNINTQDLKEIFELDMFHYRQLLQAVISLKEKQLLKIESYGGMLGSAVGFYPDISISSKLALAIIQGDKIDEAKKDYSDPLSVVEQIGLFFIERKDGYITTQQCMEKIKTLFEKIPQNSTLKSMYDKYSVFELSLFTYASINYFEREMFNSAGKFCDMLFDDFKQRAYHLMLIESRSLGIMKDRIVKLEDDMMMSDPNIALEHNASKKIFGISSQKLSNGKLEYATVLKHTALKQNLYFEKSISMQMRNITSNLLPHNYKSVMKKLKTNNMPPSFNILFYGYPGTGKTAMAYHIAYITKRDVFQVDISKIKDKYVGESEKKIKGIFDEYAREAKLCEQKPILLFNEADALIGNRVTVDSSVDQMHNSMQNILLDELEKFDGILIATTNLVDNLDNAFSRRFLYKLEFPKPDIQIREKIWRGKLSSIDEKTLKKVLEFELSGGQIENVAKKYLLESVLKNKTNDSIILDMVKEESSFKQSKKVNMGFLS